MGDPAVEKLSKRGFSTFLAEHEECGGGFEVQRREGSAGAIVRVICGGCGKSTEYPAMSDEEMVVDRSASRRSALRTGRRKPGTEDRPSRKERQAGTSAPRAKNGEPRGGAARARSIDWRSWLPGLIAGLIGGALVLIVLAIASGDDGSGGGSAPTGESAKTGTPTATAPTTPTSTAPAVARRQSKPSREATKLDRRRLAERVSIGVPRGWNAGVSGGAVTLSARNGRAEVQVYYEPGAKSEIELERASKTFLLQRHPGARVAAAGPADAGGRQARSVRVIYPGGTESATVLVAGGYSYLILERLGKPSSPEARKTAKAVTMSFRPI